MIKNYKNFILENLEPEKNDSIDIVSSKNALNKMEEEIKEYNAKRGTLYNLYMKSLNEIELNKLLVSNKFLNISDPKKTIFYNKLLGMSAEIFKKQRQINNLNLSIDKLKKDMDNEKTNIKNNPSSKQYGDENIKLMNDKMKVKTKEINKLNQDCAKLELDLKEKMKQYQKEINDNKNKLQNEPRPL